MQTIKAIYPGDVKITGSFQVMQEKPVDDRMVVGSEDDLINIEYWYNGLVCALAGTSLLRILALPDDAAETEYKNADTTTEAGRNLRLGYWREISGSGGGSGYVDTAFNATSLNPVQNRVVTNKFNEVDTSIDDLQQQLYDLPSQLTLD